MSDQNTLNFESLYASLIEKHPSLLQMLVWKDGVTLLNENNPVARLDARTNFLTTLVRPFLPLLTHTRVTLSDFQDGLKNVRSVTKTITSILAGMVFGNRIEEQLDEPIAAYLPSIPKDDPKAAIRLRHLLSNTSGLPTIEDIRSMRRLLSTPNWVDTILRYPLHAAPGETYIYSSANFHLTNAILARVLGANLLEYAKKELFGSLGIQSLFWNCDPQGVPFGGSDLYLRAEDMLKIGQLCLNKGKWKNTHIIPSTWLELATQPRIKVNEADNYGYGWWVDHKREAGCCHTISACGVGGQRIVLVPHEKTVIVTTSLTSLHVDSSVIDDAICDFFQ